MNRLTCTLATSLLAVVGATASAQEPAIEFLNSGKIVPATLPFSEAVRVGDTLYLSGQVGIKDGRLVTGGFERGLELEVRHAPTLLRFRDGSRQVRVHGFGSAPGRASGISNACGWPVRAARVPWGPSPAGSGRVACEVDAP